MSDRVYNYADTEQYIENNIYAKRDVGVIHAKLEAVVDKIRADRQAGVNVSFCDVVTANSDGTVASAEKSKFGVKAADYTYTTNSGEQKTITTYSVIYTPRCFEGISIIFHPKVYQGKLTFGEASCYQKGEDGKAQLYGTGIDAIIAVFQDPDLDEQTREGGKELCGLLEYFRELENIKDEVIPRGRTAGNWKPWFIATKINEVLENPDNGQYSEVYVAKLQSAVEKMKPLAEAMAKAITDANAWVKVEKESKDKDENGNPKTYQADASLRINYVLRTVPVKDDAGNYIKVARKSDGKMVDKLVPAKDANGELIYDAFIDIPGTGIRFDVDVTKETATIKGPSQDIWVGNVLDRRFGWKETSEKGTAETKALIDAIRPLAQENMQNTPLYDLTQRLRAAVIEKSPDALDENGNVRLDQNGNPLKAEYVSWKKAYTNPQTGYTIPGHPQINLTGDGRNALIEILPDADYPEILRATYVEFRGEGEKPHRTILNNKEATAAVLENAPYLNELLAKEVPTTQEERRRPNNEEEMGR